MKTMSLFRGLARGLFFTGALFFTAIGAYAQSTTPTNIPPVVTFSSPANGSVYVAPATIQLIAIASDSGGYVTSVEFFSGSNSLGLVTNFAIVDPAPGRTFIPGSRAFFLTWSNVPAGPQIVVTNFPPPASPVAGSNFVFTNTAPYILTAKATANNGLSTVSSPVSVIVVPGPPSNEPPIVRLTSPPDHSVFRAPLTLPIFAYAFDPASPIAGVEFFDGSNLLGPGVHIGPTPLPATPASSTTPVSPAVIPSPVPPIVPLDLFVYVWSNAPIGEHMLTAEATASNGASTISTPVDITVLPPIPPPTNFPDIVSIVATDPIAIAGTNCWPWLGLAGAPPTWSNWVSPAAVLVRFTNCGPQNAIFTVRRLGSLSNDLDVSYSIGGTASNGVDYEMLPGQVTIPASQASSQITIVPIFGTSTISVTANNVVTVTNLPRPLSTVILALTPSSSTSPPGYLIGLPRKAEAIILDGTGPVPLTTSVLPDRTFNLTGTGPEGAWFDIQYSSDLSNWTSLCTNQIIGGSIDFLDPDAAANVTRFYRAIPAATAP
jgi:hypothetical protein